MEVSYLLQQLEPVGRLAYALIDRIGSNEPIVQLFISSPSLNVLIRQPNHVTHGKFSRLRAPMSVL